MAYIDLGKNFDDETFHFEGYGAAIFEEAQKRSISDNLGTVATKEVISTEES